MMMYYNRAAYREGRGRCRVHSWEVGRIWEPSALRSDLPPLIMRLYAMALSHNP